MTIDLKTGADERRTLRLASEIASLAGLVSDTRREEDRERQRAHLSGLNAAVAALNAHLEEPPC